MSYPGRIPGRVRIGMTAPLATYDDRLAETGPVFAQRIFCDSLTDDESATAAAAWAAGRLPIVSFKPRITKDDPIDWKTAAAGGFDTQVAAALDRLAAPVPAVVVFQHEPASDGAQADWTRMQARLLPMVRDRGLAAGVILNGFWFGDNNGGLSDAQLAAWLPDSLLPLVDVTGADLYESDRNPVPVLVDRLLAWADRRGITELGIGELGVTTPQALADVGQRLLGHADRLGWACWYNSPRGAKDWTLYPDGPMLPAFQALRDASVPPEAEPDPRDAQIADLTAQRDAAVARATAAEALASDAITRADALQAKVSAALGVLSS